MEKKEDENKEVEEMNKEEEKKEEEEKKKVEEKKEEEQKKETMEKSVCQNAIDSVQEFIELKKIVKELEIKLLDCNEELVAQNKKFLEIEENCSNVTKIIREKEQQLRTLNEELVSLTLNKHLCEDFVCAVVAGRNAVEEELKKKKAILDQKSLEKSLNLANLQVKLNVFNNVMAGLMK